MRKNLSAVVAEGIESSKLKINVCFNELVPAYELMGNTLKFL